MLFENKDGKHHIPVEVIDQLNIYSNVTISSSVLATATKENIRILFLDKYGELMGTYTPEGFEKDAHVTIKQAISYADEGQRVSMSRIFENAGIHNMRANLKYYNSRNKNLEKEIKEFDRFLLEIKNNDSIENMMLVEARARKVYYRCFNTILNDPDFVFTERSKRPPKDALNAMISFGNTLLYDEILRLMWQTSLNPQIGVVHAANRRNYSLHLDFADIFKPIIVDRVIFSLINGKQIKKEDFVPLTDEDGIYISKSGKKIFVRAFEDKLNSKVVINNREYSYRQIIARQLNDYQRHIVTGEKYKPYKYY